MEAYVVEFVFSHQSVLVLSMTFYTCREFMKLTSRTIAPFCNDNNRLDLYEKAQQECFHIVFMTMSFIFLGKKNMKSGWSCKRMWL